MTVTKKILEKADESMDSAFHCAGHGCLECTKGHLRIARGLYAKLHMRQHVAVCYALLAELAQRPAV